MTVLKVSTDCHYFVMFLFWSLTLAALLDNSGAYIVDPGPKIKATRGELWPRAQHQRPLDGFYTLKPSHFRFQVLKEDCGVLQGALQRYWAILNHIPQKRAKNAQENLRLVQQSSKWLGKLTFLEIAVAKNCSDQESIKPTTSEQYTLEISNDTCRLTAENVWGALRGLESFSQLVHLASDDTTVMVNATYIDDYPRFSHRGLLLDTARHYLPVKDILETLTAMSYNKLNVFHWHIIDDQSFPYVSKKFPELSEKGAYHPELMIYTEPDVQKVLEHARVRGIRVMVEFDTPGHTRSMGVGMPELLTPCRGKFEGKLGPLDPSRPFVYSFLRDFLQELMQTFPDPYLHLGGDEVGFECWASNPDVNHFMDSLNITGNYSALESYYVNKLLKIVAELSAEAVPVIWQEVFDNQVALEPSTVVHVWKDGYKSELANVTEAGFKTLLSSCWYLDHLQTGGDWEDFYACEPRDFPGSDQQRALVIGGEACMWGEVVDERNLGPRLWPRASAAAEKLWSQPARLGPETYRRIEEHACRMVRRGIPAQPPNGPGFCLTN